MRNSDCCRIAILMMLAISVVAAGESTAPAPGKDSYPARVIAAANAQYSRHSYVTALELSPGGRILLAWARYSGDGQDHAANAFVLCHSDDAGRTWSEPVELPCGKPRMNLGGGSLVKAGKRLQFYFWFRNGGNDSSLQMIESPNDGTTWGLARTLTPKAVTSFTAANDRVIRLTKGRLICPIHTLTGRPDPSKDLGVLIGRSDNDGETWLFAPELNFFDNPGTRGYRYATTFPYAPDQREAKIPLKLHEPSVVECRDGTLLMLVRSTRGRFFVSRSADAGVTWSKLEPSDIVTKAAPPYLKRLADGRLLLLWNPPTPTEVEKNTFGANKRETLQMAFSSDDGKTWSKPVVIANDGGANGFCYPAAIELTKTHELLIFATRSPAVIYPSDLVSFRVPLQ